MFFRKSYPYNDKVYQLDKFSAKNADDIYKTIAPIKGEDVPQPYIFVINKETKNVEVYKDIVFSEEDGLILCDETRKKMESDDSVITLFHNDFHIIIYPCDSYPKNAHECDMVPFVYTKVGDQYVILHRYNLSGSLGSMNNTWDNLRVVAPLGGGAWSGNNMPLIIVRKNERSIIFAEERGHGYWYTGYGMLYETNEPIESIYYTRTASSGRWLLTKHQIIINNGKDVTILLTERGDDNFFNSIDFKDSTVTPLDEFGEFLIIDPNNKPKYAVRVDKNGYHKTRIMKGRNGTEPVSLPKHIGYINCLRRNSSVGCLLICDEDTDQIYRIQDHATKDNCLEIIEISPYPVTERETESWKALYKRGDTWYATYKTRIPDTREAIYPEEEKVLLDRSILGIIDKNGTMLSIKKFYSLIPKSIDVPVCKRIGNHYERLPDYRPNIVYNTDIIESGETHVSYYAVMIEVLSTNISQVMRKEVPWMDMKLWWHRKR